MGIGDWGLGIGDWGLGPIPNPQSPDTMSINFNKFKIKIAQFKKILYNYKIKNAIK
jgi:hypothetical protein